MISIVNGYKVYKALNNETLALSNINIEIKENSYLSIMGESGSGKSTLLNIMAGYDFLTTGQYYFAGKSINKATNEDDYPYKKDVGFIFQNGGLLPYLKVKDNLLLPFLYNKESFDKDELVKICQRLQLEDVLGKYPNQLSGGQQQRCCIARTLLQRKNIILADEPTASLDKENSEVIFKIFEDLYQTGKTIILVTHNSQLANQAQKVIKLSHGKIVF